MIIVYSDIFLGTESTYLGIKYAVIIFNVNRKKYHQSNADDEFDYNVILCVFKMAYHLIRLHPPPVDSPFGGSLTAGCSFNSPCPSVLRHKGHGGKK